MLWPEAPDVRVRLAGIVACLCVREVGRGCRASDSFSFGFRTRSFIWWNRERGLPPVKIKHPFSSRITRDAAGARVANRQTSLIGNDSGKGDQNVIRKRRRVVR